MASHIVGYPRMGPKRELKLALESFWDGKSSAGDLQKVAADLRESIWKQMADTGIKYTPSNTFSYYDQMLDTTAMLGAVPPRYGWNGGEIGFDVCFSMARGNATVPAMEMTKWFDTNYHFIVPELGPDVKFSYASHKAVTEYKEAKALGVDTVPVLVGPVSYLLLSKPAKGVEKSFSLLSLLGKILPIYKEVISELKEAGASWIQFDEPTLGMDLESHKLQAFTEAYSALESTLSGLNVLIEAYFADNPAEQYKTLTSLKGVTAFDLIDLRNLPEEGKEEIGISLHAITGSLIPKTMRVKIMVNNYEFIALIDTGSNLNFLQPWVAQKMGLKIIEDDTIEVRIADGSILRSEGSCPEFKFAIQGAQFATQAHILQLDGCDVLLGIQWLKGLGPIWWDFTSLQMEIQQEGGKRILIEGMNTEESEEDCSPIFQVPVWHADCSPIF